MNECCKKELRDLAAALEDVRALLPWWARWNMRFCGAWEFITLLVAALRNPPEEVVITGNTVQTFRDVPYEEMMDPAESTHRNVSPEIAAELKRRR